MEEISDVIEVTQESFSVELYKDFLEAVGKRNCIGDELKTELLKDFPSDMLEMFILKFTNDKLVVKKSKGVIVSSCQSNHKYSLTKKVEFSLYKSDKTNQLLSSINGEKICLILNNTVIKNSYYDKFIAQFISDKAEENAAEIVYKKIEEYFM